MEDTCLSWIDFGAASPRVPERTTLAPATSRSTCKNDLGPSPTRQDEPLLLRRRVRAEGTGWLGGAPASESRYKPSALEGGKTGGDPGSSAWEPLCPALGTRGRGRDKREPCRQNPGRDPARGRGDNAGACGNRRQNPHRGLFVSPDFRPWLSPQPSSHTLTHAHSHTLSHPTPQVGPREPPSLHRATPRPTAPPPTLNWGAGPPVTQGQTRLAEHEPEPGGRSDACNHSPASGLAGEQSEVSREQSCGR